MADEFLKQVYDLESQADTDAYYTKWAATYDDELTREGYRSPQRCAQALAQFVAGDAAILDIGCGTGLSGRALAAAGFTNISGQDVNADMLAHTQGTGIYRETWVTDLDDPFPFRPGTYAAFAAIGVIGVGAAPPSLLARSLLALAEGGHIVFSFNEHALELPEFSSALDDVIATGLATQAFCENGPHIEGLNTTSNVYVLRRAGIDPRSA